MKYNVGDKVRIKSLDWYNENKNEHGLIMCGMMSFYGYMSCRCGTIVTISEILEWGYCIEEDYGENGWTDEMIEGLVEEETLIERVDDNGLPFNEWLSHKGFFYVPDGYELKDENGKVINAHKIVLEKKEKEYPKTYETCWYKLKHDINHDKVEGYKSDILSALQKLLICRDAYWKIAGEKMGLGKPWEPDWTNEHQVKYTIYTMGNDVIRHVGNYIHSILAFPTEEMRDAFKENFDPDIEICKELL